MASAQEERTETEFGTEVVSLEIVPEEAIEPAEAEESPIEEYVPLTPREYLYATYPHSAHALDAIIRCESGWFPGAKNSHSTASGLAQFLNTTWAGTPQGRAGYSVFDPIANIDGAAWLYANSGPWPWLASNGCHRLLR